MSPGTDPQGATATPDGSAAAGSADAVDGSVAPPCPELSVPVDRPLLDEPVPIRVTGVPGGKTVRLRATATWAGQRWQSTATFRPRPDDGADGPPTGTVDTRRAAPVTGTAGYGDETGADPRGLLWSMRPVEGDTLGGAGPAVAATDAATMRVELTAMLGDRVVDSTTVTRVVRSRGVEREAVGIEGVAGTLFRPAGGDRHPLVLLLGGACRPPPVPASVLASRGYATLALSYADGEDRPAPVEGVRLSTVARALEWFRDREAIADDRVAVVGFRKGGELALLAGATLDRVGPVVSVAGSGAAVQSLPDRFERPDAPWRIDVGTDPDPTSTAESAFLPWEATGEELASLVGDWCRRDPVRARPLYERGLWGVRSAVRQEATFPVERTDGPVLLVSPGDDAVWPAERLAEFAAARLSADADASYRHVTYSGAGHALTVPGLPTTTRGSRGTSIPGLALARGGRPAEDAAAEVDLWRRTLGTLSGELQTPNSDR